MLSASLSVWANTRVLPDFHTSPTNTATLGAGTSPLLSIPLNHSWGCTPGVACDVTRGPGHLSPWGCAQKGSSVGAPWVLPPVAPALSSPSPPSASHTAHWDQAALIPGGKRCSEACCLPRVVSKSVPNILFEALRAAPKRSLLQRDCRRQAGCLKGARAASRHVQAALKFHRAACTPQMKHGSP